MTLSKARGIKLLISFQTVLLLTLVFLSNAVYGQQKKIDSLRSIITEFPNHLPALILYCELIGKNDPAQALPLENRALTIAKAKGMSPETCRLYNMLGNLYNIRSNYDSSNIYHHLALKIALQENYERERFFAYQGIAENFMRLSNSDSLRHYLSKAQELLAALKSPLLEAGIYNNWGNFYLGDEDYQEALEYFIKSAKIYEAEGNDVSGLSRSYANIGNIECVLGNYDKAIDYTGRSLALAKKYNFTQTIAYCYKLLGRIYRKQLNYEQSLVQYEQASKIYNTVGDKRSLCETYHSIGNIYFDQRKFKEALEQYDLALKLAYEIRNVSQIAYIHSALGNTWYELKNYAKSTLYYDSSIVNARRIKSKYLLMDAYMVLSTIEEEQKNYQKALRYFHSYASVRDSIVEEEKKSSLSEVEAKYQNEKKQNEITLLHKDQELKAIYLEQQQTILIALILAIVLLFIIGGLLFNRYRLIYNARRQLEIERVRNHIARDLHDDIGSTISSINIISQIATKENKPESYARHFQRIEEQSSKVLESMSDMVWSINPDNDSLEKMVARMKEFTSEILDPLNISYEFKEQTSLDDIVLDIEKRKDFFLIYKEAINNAAKYSHCTRIEISLSKTATGLTLSISDNGIGFDIATIKTGNGLRNMRERASEIDAKISWKSSTGEGTTVTVEIPF